MLLLIAFIEDQRLPVQFAKTLCFDIANTVFRAMVGSDVDIGSIRSSQLAKWMSGEIASLEEMKVSISTVSGAIAELVAAARVRDNNVYKRVKSYIDANCLDIGFSIMSLADALEVSTSYVSHLFKRINGVTILAYVTEHRIARAQSLLLDGSASIGEIARAVGYTDQSAFTRRFRQVTGETPGAYRTSHLPAIANR